MSAAAAVRLNPAEGLPVGERELTRLAERILLIRRFEEAVLRLAADGIIYGPAHSSIGQEAVAVGVSEHLGDGDAILGTHRGHHQFLAKALNYVQRSEVLPAHRADVCDVLVKTLSEICGLAAGYCGGRGGSMHLQWLEAGAMGTNAIVGGGVPSALGFAYSARIRGKGEVAVAYFGDGAFNIGSVLESFNLASAWQLPVCFVVENNQYALATSLEESVGETNLALRGPAFGIETWVVDGNDVVAIAAAMAEVREYMSVSGRPTLIVAETYRTYHQNGPMLGSVFGYRTREEEKEWARQDPVDLVRERFMQAEGLGERAWNDLDQRVGDLVDEVVAGIVSTAPDGRRSIADDLRPDPAAVDSFLMGDASELDGLPAEPSLDGLETENQKYITTVARTMKHNMAQDSRIVVFGEDIHRLNGGTNGATRGLVEDFPDRVHGTPISENAFTGMALGMAMSGEVRPIVEYMYADFMWVAADQLFNQVGKARHMFGGHSEVPLVLRAKAALGGGYASQHSLEPAGVFAMSSGWRIVAPSSPMDYIGLMNAALRLQDPVYVMENLELYPTSGPVPVQSEDWDFIIPPGSARLLRKGDALTIISYSGMLHHIVAALDELGIDDVDLIDLRWLDRASIDWETIEASVRKTNRVLIADQAPLGFSYGAWLSDEISRRLFDHLDHEIERISGSLSSPAASAVLEAAAIPRKAAVIEALRVFGFAKGDSA